MSKEKYKQIIDEVYKNYTQNTPENHVAGSDSDPMKLSMDWKGKNDYSSGYPILERLSKEEFICKIKTDDEFSQKWGIRIKERKLSVKERLFFINKSDEEYEKALLNKEQYESIGLDFELALSSRMNDLNIPTRIITLTYNNEKIESYE